MPYNTRLVKTIRMLMFHFPELCGLLFVASSTADEECPPNRRRCGKSPQCVSILAFCDGVNDCKNHYDENPERCGETIVVEHTYCFGNILLPHDAIHINISTQKAQHAQACKYANARTHAPCVKRRRVA